MTTAIPVWRQSAPPGVPLAQAEALLAPVVAAKPAPASVPDPGWLVPMVRDRWMGLTARGWTPDRVELVLRSALSGDHAAQWELFDLMEDTWPRLLKNLGEIKRSVRKMNWTVLPWAEDDQPPTPDAEQRAAAVSRAIWTMEPAPAEADNGFLDTVTDVLDAWGKGTVVLEIDWRVRADKAGDMFAPRATHWVHPKFYGWSSEGWVGLRTPEQHQVQYDPVTPPGTLTPFPPHKFIVGIARAKTGHPLGTALLRPLAWWWCAANFSAEWWLNFAQLFGVPLRWANYAATAPADTISKIQLMLKNMGSAAWAAFPEGTTLQLLESTKGGAGTNPQQALLDHADTLCDILILGQTLTTDVGDSGSRALGDVHQSVRDDIICSAADWAAEVLTQQLVAPMCELTWGDREMLPELVAEPRRAEDAKGNAERDKILLDAGLELPKEWLYERHNIPMPAEGDETVGRKPASVQPLGQPVPGQAPTELPPGDDEEPAQARAYRARSAQEKLVERIAEDTTGIERRWLGGTLPWFRRLVAAAEDPKLTDAEFIALVEARSKRLPEELAPLINVDSLREAMEAHMGAAVVNGAVSAWMKRRGEGKQ